MTQSESLPPGEEETVDEEQTQSLLNGSSSNGIHNGTGKSVAIGDTKFSGSPDAVENGLGTKPQETAIREKVADDGLELHYKLEDIPPWYTCIMLGMQHYLAFVVGIVSVPLIMCPQLCMLETDPGRGYIVSTLIFVSGMVTLLQATFGVRLPIVQGSSFGFMTPALAILNLPQWQCPPVEELELMSAENRTQLWQERINEVSGAIAVASIVQILCGYCGLVGLLLKFITPLTIAPTVTLIGLALFKEAAKEASGNWWISVLTILMITILSLYMRNIQLPLPSFKKGSKTRSTYPLFQIFPILISLASMWILCAVLTVSGVLPPGDLARTDIKMKILEGVPWFRFPYPGQWGLPTASAAAVVGMLAGVISGSIESVGDYYACAKFCAVPPPPMHAVNRGIGTEGVGCLIGGLWGTGNGTTSFSQNIGVIGVTKVGSRRVVQWAGGIMMLLGVFCKVGSFFITIPGPVIGGIFCVTFGMVAAVGISTLHFVSLNSFRNMYIIGFSIFFALVLPQWMEAHPGVIKTGSEFLDQMFTVLLSTSMFVAGFIGFVLDNTVPGSAEERGLTKWKEQHDTSTPGSTEKVEKCYNLPFGMELIRRHKILQKFPCLPAVKDYFPSTVPKIVK
ncbi:solute carrier family 23 member 1 [Ischnura elegans]|uniref:solute carrier family 23 member 1 n=1 Tax=Ischnura elegans TaxID=197161 RepID=UPI001ED8A43B|nr:solute carrier family 23 member 1 [Ischnura elegans]XP_046396216.1 solute carrier family 23 member 1 [Ischnura elegans]XP_046396218.1 solute carrier family 23 member 1 [Ischnura elegans]XP_046396219.1 solute carrier family 23 member 1 [Ischnura elegans]